MSSNGKEYKLDLGFTEFGEVGIRLEEVNAYMIAYKEKMGIMESGLAGNVKGDIAGVKLLLKSGSHFDLVGGNAKMFLEHIGHGK